MQYVERFFDRLRKHSQIAEAELGAKPNPLKEVFELIGSDDPDLYMKLGHALLDLSRALLPKLGREIEEFRRAWEMNPHETSREILDPPLFFFQRGPTIHPYMVTSFVRDLEPLAQMRKPTSPRNYWNYVYADFHLPLREELLFGRRIILPDHPLRISFSIDNHGVRRAQLVPVDQTRKPEPHPQIEAKFAKLQQGL